MESFNREATIYLFRLTGRAIPARITPSHDSWRFGPSRAESRQTRQERGIAESAPHLASGYCAD